MIVFYRCRALPDELEDIGQPRFREHTEQLLRTFNHRDLWDVFGVVDDVTVSLLVVFISVRC